MIKRIFAAVILFAALAGCTDNIQTPVKPKASFISRSCKIESAGRTYSAIIANSAEGLTAVYFTEPPAVNGLSYTFTSDGWKTSYGDLTFSLDAAPPQWVVPGRICSILQHAAKDDNTESTNAGAVDYSMDIDEKTGEILKIVSNDIVLTFE